MSGSFGNPNPEPPINPWLTFYQSQNASNQGIADTLANKLAANTLDSRTQILANTAESGGLANQFATQKNPLEITQLRQQLGLESSPNLDRLMGVIGGGGSAASAGGKFVPGTPFVPKNLPAGITPDEDAMVRTVSGEAAGQPLAGQIGVASVIKNRATGAGVSPQAVVFSPNQFEPWNGGPARARLEAMDPSSPEYQAILNNVVRPVLAGKTPDPTGGATHFYAPGAQAALGRPAPSWGAGTPSAVIGGHQFYALGYGPGGGPRTDTAPPSAQAAPAPAANPAAPPTLPDGHDHDRAIAVSGGLMQAVLDAPPEARPAMWAQFRPIMLQAGAIHAPENYPGDQAASAMRDAAFDPQAKAKLISAVSGSTQVAGPGAPVAASQPVDASSPSVGAPAPTSVAPVAATAAPPPVPNENPMLAMAAPAGGQAAAPVNAMTPVAAPVAALTPPPQSANLPSQSANPQPATGMNSPQVIQAQQLLAKAAQIGLIAAQTPNDPRVKATSEAAIADLKARAALLMQADSVTKDPVTGVQTHTLTGLETAPANDTRRVTVREENGYQITQQGDKILSRVPVTEYKIANQAYERNSKEIAGISDAGRAAQADQIRLQSMRDILEGHQTGAPAKQAMATWLQRYAPDKVNDFVKSVVNLPDVSALEEFSKLALTGAGTQERGVLGGRGGFQAIRLFQQANPSNELQTQSNKYILAKQLIGDQLDSDYSQAAVDHFTTQESRLGAERKYTSLEQFDRDWNAQRNAQVGAAAMGALAGQPASKWADGLKDAEYQRALDLVSRADPGAVVQGRSGPLSMQPTNATGGTPVAAPPGRATAPTTAVPPPAERKANTVYPTPKGPMTWTGTGWLPAPAQ